VAISGQSVPILRRCRRELVHAHQVHFAQWVRTSRDFWAGLQTTYEVLTTQDRWSTLEVRQNERKEEIKPVFSDDAGLIY
jgi:hypothetical protein